MKIFQAWKTNPALLSPYNVFLLSTEEHVESKHALNTTDFYLHHINLSKRADPKPAKIFLYREDDLIEIFWDPQIIKYHDEKEKYSEQIKLTENKIASGFWALRGKRF